MSVAGVNSTQIWEIVKNAFEDEQTEIDDKNAEVTSLEDEKTAYSSIDNVLEELRTSLYSFTKTSSFLKRTVSSSDSESIVATASSSAPETSFTFSSVSQLATAARVTSQSSLGLTSGTPPYAQSAADINGATNFNPNLGISNAQGGAQIISGSFYVNDISIKIKAGDTLNTILTRINNSAAGVTAVFDEATDTVRISGAYVGSDEEITFDSNGTNIFEALGITSYTAGTDDQWEADLDDTALSGVNAGYFTVNNFTFYVDPATESLTDILRKVNNSNAGVSVFYDDATNKVTMQNKQEGTSLLLANDTSGFLAALGFMNQSSDLDGNSAYSEYKGQKARFVLNGETTERDTNTFTIQGVTFTLLSTKDTPSTITVARDKAKSTEVATSFVSQFNATISLLDGELDNTEGALENNTTLRTIRNKLINDVLAQIENPGQYGSLVDIGFGIEKSSGGSFSLTLDEEMFNDALEEDEQSLQKLFAYDGDNDGLLDEGGFAIAMREYLDSFTRTVSGFFYKRQEDIDEQIDDVEVEVDDLEDELTAKQERMFEQYVNQVSQLQKLQQQQSDISSVSSSLAAYS